jgi:hypothetical protein
MKAGVVPSVWSYFNEDGDSVIVTDFFEEARMTVGDLVMVYNESPVCASKTYRVSAKSTDTFKATVIALASQLMSASASEIVTANSLYNTISANTLVTLLVTAGANEASVFTASATTDRITLVEPIVDGVHFVLTTTTTLPAGLSLATAYYSVESDGYTCKLSATRGGSAINITDAGTGTHTATVQKNFFVLADGYNNQRKIVKVKTDGGIDAVILPDNLEGGTIITAGDANDAFELIFVEDEWHLAKNLGVAIS